ncbi:hypothetical protein ACFLWN_00560 [Chloroflexota bacterium]
MSTKLLIPILNNNVTLFKGPTWYLSPDISIETISAEYFGLIYAFASEEYKSLISAKSKCIIIDNINPDISTGIAITQGLIVSFILNYFKRLHPVVISFAIQLTKKKKSKIDKILDLPIIADARLQRGNRYHIKADLKRDTVSDFYKVVNAVHIKHPNITISLERFNSSLLRFQLHDRIIDITISLESLINGTTELRNRFSMYNAWVAEADSKKRTDCFKLLGFLYDARSAIVHGQSMKEKEYRKKIDPILARWEEVIKVAERALGYHLLYVYTNSIEKWYKHQENLVLGIERRIA